MFGFYFGFSVCCRLAPVRGGFCSVCMELKQSIFFILLFLFAMEEHVLFVGLVVLFVGLVLAVYFVPLRNQSHLQAAIASAANTS